MSAFRIERYLFILTVLFCEILPAQVELEKVESRYLKKLYRLNDSIYRSEQPSRKGFAELEDIGLKTVLNLRRNVSDDKKARGRDLSLYWIPLKSKEIDQNDILQALTIIKNSEKPLLIHCWHGSDRTGAVSVAYRLVFENWTKEEAIEELRKNELGYHENWYPNIIELIQNLDISQLRQDLELD